MEKKYLKYKTKYFRKLMFGKGLDNSSELLTSEPLYSWQRIKMSDNILSEPYYVINKLNTPGNPGDITSAFIQRIYNRLNSIFKVRFNLEEETQYIFEVKKKVSTEGIEGIDLDECLGAIKTAFDKNELPKSENSVSVNYEEKVLEGMKHLLNEEYKGVFYQPANTVYTLEETAGKSTSLDVTDWKSVQEKLKKSIDSDFSIRNAHELKIGLRK